MALSPLRLLLVVAVASAWVLQCSVCYERPKARETLSVPLIHDPDGQTPQQVHISMVGSDKMRVSWITNVKAPPIVDYGTSSGSYTSSSTGSSSTYSFRSYTSGHIHHAVVGPLHPSTVYYYRCNSNSAIEFSFTTPPSQLPINFVVVGDLGQTGWTNSTLTHVGATPYDVLLLPGDLSYADSDQPLWDSYGRLVSPLASSRPWMVTEGNHEIEKHHSTEFTSYNARWRMPFEQSTSTSNLYYSFFAAGGAVHVIMLGAYTDFTPGSDQHNWLAGDLAGIDRSVTPWVVALTHVPWYNSNEAHQGEGDEMREALEGMLYDARVDVVFVGHVHAYERFGRVYGGGADGCGPVHVTIGDGGNREGLATDFMDPKPDVSVFREASFGHGRFEVVNASHARWGWHRNDDDEAVLADQVWITSLSSNPACKN